MNPILMYYVLGTLFLVVGYLLGHANGFSKGYLERDAEEYTVTVADASAFPDRGIINVGGYYREYVKVDNHTLLLGDLVSPPLTPEELEEFDKLTDNEGVKNV